MTICGTVMRDNEAQKAILIRNGSIDAWIPRSQIKNRKDNGDGTVAISIPMWLAVEKGIEFNEGLPEEEVPF